jgi:predicted O-methyltransferase YrrM
MNTLEPIRDVEVQLRTWDIDLMKKYAQQIKPNGCYLEIGTKYGGSAYLARCSSDPSVKIYSVDPKANLYMFNGTEKEVGINWIEGRSTEVAKEWKEPIDLLFIDGDHGEGTITAPTDDFNAWEGFVNQGGIIIMHDYHPDYPAVVRACDKILETGKYELVEKPPELAPRQDTDMFIVKKL